MLNPLGSYADLIKVLAGLALLGGLFVTGCQHGADRQASKDQAAITKAEKQRDDARAEAAENLRAADACGLLLKDVNRQTQAAIDDAARQKVAANEAARRAKAAAAESQRRAAEQSKALREAKNQPGCRQQLEQTLCDAIPLL